MEKKDKETVKKALQCVALGLVIFALGALVVFVSAENIINGLLAILGLGLTIAGILEIIKGFRHAGRDLKEKSSKELVLFWLEALIVTVIGLACAMFFGAALLF